MKKVILTVSLMISMNTFTQTLNFNNTPTQINLHLNALSGKNILDNSRDVRVGPLVMLGGASFLAAGLLTTPFYQGGSTTVKKPFFQQGPRTWAILSGGFCLVGGVVISLTGN